MLPKQKNSTCAPWDLGTLLQAGRGCIVSDEYLSNNNRSMVKKKQDLV